jgi:hypothetical protein
VLRPCLPHQRGGLALTCEAEPSEHLNERPAEVRPGSSARRRAARSVGTSSVNLQEAEGPPSPGHSAAPASLPRLVGCTVVEEAFVCPTGGGFENETWRVRVNDDWLTIADLVRRRSVGDITAELVDGHDPNGVESSGTLPPQTSFYRKAYVVAPVGTQLWRRVIRPVIDRTRTYSDYLLAGDISVARKSFDDYFVLRGVERLIPRALDLEHRSRAKEPVSKPVTREQAHQHASAILTLLSGGAPPTSRMT